MLRGNDCEEDLYNEIGNLQRADHDNIIKLVDYQQSDNNHYLIFEYCNGGTLL